MNLCKTTQKKWAAKGKTRKNAKKSATFVAEIKVGLKNVA